MKIFSPHRRKMEASRRYGSKEFQNKIKKAQSYKRIFDPRKKGLISGVLQFFHLNSPLVQLPVIGLFAVVLYFLLISDYFLVTNINITGTQQIMPDQIREIVLQAKDEKTFFVPKSHLAIMSRKHTFNLLSAHLPLVKEIVSYKRVWPNGVEIEISERRPGFALNIDGKNYLVDEEGVVVKELESTEGLTIVYDQVSETVSGGERLNNTKLVGFIVSALKGWSAKINSGIKEMKIPGKAATQVQIVSNEGWGVFLDVNRPMEGQLSNLALILSRQIPAKDRLNLAYIDLRFDKWAYYCYKNAPCESQPQGGPQPEGEASSEKIEVQ